MTFDRANDAFSSSSILYTLDLSESDTVQAIRIIALDSFGIGMHSHLQMCIGYLNLMWLELVSL